jgi:hypothetical protein
LSFSAAAASNIPLDLLESSTLARFLVVKTNQL